MKIMNIHKLTKDGKVIIPATTIDAVLDPESKLSLAEILYPVETNVSYPEIIEVGKANLISYKIKSTKQGKDVSEDCIYSIDDIDINEGYSESLNPSAPVEITKELITTYQGKDYVSVITINAVYPSFVGCVAPGIEVNADVVANFEKVLNADKEAEFDVQLQNERFVYAYPKSFGDLESIKDINGFEMIESFEKDELLINGVAYYIYILKTECTIEGKYCYIFG